MGIKLWLYLLKSLRLHSQKGKASGFTILELLVATLIATFVVIGLTSFVVDLLETDRREYARSETQREMQMALDFIVNDVREAAYIYNNQELNNSRGNIPSLRSYLQIPAGYEPILAFWKPEQVPYQQGQTFPDCNAFGQGTPLRVECDLLQTRRRTYTLVVYFHAINPRNDSQWKGVSRIMRYQLRMYDDPAHLHRTTGYVEPFSNNVTFSTWPVSLDGNGNIASNPGSRPDVGSPSVLVDFVDFPNLARTSPAYSDNLRNIATLQCPTNYPRIPPDGNPSGFDNPSFVVCVSSPTTTTGSTTTSTNQDVVIFLRGNPTGKAGIKVAPLLAVKTQAVARGVIDKRPQ